MRHLHGVLDGWARRGHRRHRWEGRAAALGPGARGGGREERGEGREGDARGRRDDLVREGGVGEAEAKRTSSEFYTTEFPTMIKGWRDDFQTPDLPFLYVELCTEYGAKEPKEGDFWQADHIEAVAEGGGSCGLKNLRTLCVPCHKNETEKLRSRLRLCGGRASPSDANAGGPGQMDIRSAFMRPQCMGSSGSELTLQKERKKRRRTAD